MKTIELTDDEAWIVRTSVEALRTDLDKTLRDFDPKSRVWRGDTQARDAVENVIGQVRDAESVLKKLGPK
jgi:hypothetical protein